jgi:hypothetical protein
LSVSPDQANELQEQYELLREHALSPDGPCRGWGLVALLRGGMSAWIQALLTLPQPHTLRAAITSPPSMMPLTPGEGDWVLALAALVLGRADPREVRHV